MNLTITHKKQINAHKCRACGVMYSIAGVVKQSENHIGEQEYVLIEQDASSMYCPYCGENQDGEE